MSKTPELLPCYLCGGEVELMDANLNNSTASFQCKKCETWLLVKLNNDVISKAICVNRWNSFGNRNTVKEFYENQD